MRLLIDTHALLWFLDDSPQLSLIAKALIEDETNGVFVSLASLWEVAIKISIGKLSLQQPFQTFMSEQLAVNGIELMAITTEALGIVATLPFHHRDPFDRLLVAQALVEQIPIVSGDTMLDRYGVRRLW